MSQSEPDRERLTLTMTALDDGLNRIARKHEGAVQFFYEDPETFGAGHFVFYPENDTRSRFAIEEQYTGTDWSDDERLPTSWTWTAERRVRHSDGTHMGGVERTGDQLVGTSPAERMIISVSSGVPGIRPLPPG